MKRLVLLLFLLTFYVKAHAQKIPPYFFGQNAWMPDTCGDSDHCRGLPLGVPCILKGKMFRSDIWELVRKSGVKLVRYGGEMADQNKPTNFQYLRAIDSIRAKGMEPIVQVPYDNNYYTADTAAAIIRFINLVSKRNVRFWIIGNEPDRSLPNGYGFTTAPPIAKYTRDFAIKMKEVDSTIITVGPELKYFNNKNNLVYDLTTPGGADDITGNVPGHTYPYLDVFTFHYYPYNGSQTRALAITNLTARYQFAETLDTANARISGCNAYHHRTSSPLKLAITEANITYKNAADTSIYGASGGSFICGQFWVEMMAIALEKGVQFINFWSIVETSLGYIAETNSFRRPVYHHFKLMAENFRGNYCKAIVSTGQKDFKAAGSSDNGQVAMLVMNQRSTGGGYVYTVRLGSGAVSGASPVKVNLLNTGQSTGAEYTDTIADQSTTLLLFDCRGNIARKVRYKLSDGYKGVPYDVPVLSNSNFIVVNAGKDRYILDSCRIMLSGTVQGKNIAPCWYTAGGGRIVSASNMPDSCLIASEGTYVLLAKDSVTGCSCSDTLRVNPIHKRLFLDTEPYKAISCRNTEVQLSASTNLSSHYIWYEPNGSLVKEYSRFKSGLLASVPGVYKVIVEEAVTGCGASKTMPVKSLIAPVVTDIKGVEDLRCDRPSVLLEANANVPAYPEWMQESQVLSIRDTLRVTVAGDYVLSMEDTASGCIGRDTATIRDLRENIVLTMDKQLLFSCADKQIVLKASENNLPAVYLWSAYDGGRILGGGTTLSNCVVAGTGRYVLTATGSRDSSCKAQGEALVLPDLNNTICGLHVLARTPTDERLSFELESVAGVPKDFFVSLYNASGEKIYEQQFTGEAESRFHIPVTNLSGGLYILSAVTAKQTFTEKIMLTR